MSTQFSGQGDQKDYIRAQSFTPLKFDGRYSTLKPRNNEQVNQTLFVHYIEYFTMSNVIWLVNFQNGSWVLLTISQNSLYRGSLNRDLSVGTIFKN